MIFPCCFGVVVSARGIVYVSAIAAIQREHTDRTRRLRYEYLLVLLFAARKQYERRGVEERQAALYLWKLDETLCLDEVLEESPKTHTYLHEKARCSSCDKDSPRSAHEQQ